MTNQEQALIQVQHLMELVRNIEIIHPRSSVFKHMTVSVGVATTISHLHDCFLEFIAQTDHALYIAKSNGQNQYHVAVSRDEIALQSSMTIKETRHLLLNYSHFLDLTIIQ